MLISCKRDPDPCAGLKPISADFKFYQKFIGIDSIFYIDTVIMNPDRNIYIPEKVWLIANEEKATYRWELEDYPKNNTTKSFFLDFDQPFGNIEVKLIVTKEPNTSCFPNDDGADTVTKTLVVLDGSKFKYAFEGTFTGCLTDNPSDIFDITIVNLGAPPQRDYKGYYGLRVYNLPKGCGRNNFTPSEYTPEITDRTYRNFYIENESYTNFPCGKDPFIAVGRVYDHNNKISIHIAAYRYDYSTNKNIRTDNQFIGIRKK
ncbi:MAG: hypothetical protein CRN43_03040 [Candidatus Nephrothrix sp. EaCA]|nr:MAG: hypothetical protein CRN43_03040 [Candidatus Nephrothrix sp. EaCA]